MKKPTSLFVETALSPYAAYIGIDWADRKHDVCLYDANVQQFESSVIGSQPEPIQRGQKHYADGLREKQSPSVPSKNVDL